MTDPARLVGAWMATALLAVGCTTLIDFDDLRYAPTVAEVCETATHACVPAVPVGWTGPLTISMGSADTPAKCGGPYESEFGHYFSGLVADEGRCECACGPPEGTVCTAAACLAFNCIAACLDDTVLIDGRCADIPNSKGYAKADVDAIVPVVPGSCPPTATRDLPDPSWTASVTACSTADLPAAGCDVGQACTPIPSAPFRSICIARTGDLACPSDFGERHLVFEDFTDDRACSECECAEPVVTCGGSVTFSDEQSFLLGTVDVGDCANSNLQDTMNVTACYEARSSGTCTPSGGELTGSVAPTTPWTFCCRSSAGDGGQGS